MSYKYTKEVKLEFNELEVRVREELQKEGFGVLTEIDVSAVLKKKLDVDYDKYKILGACNPDFAYKALQAEKEIGLLLPCNVIIYKNSEKIFVSVINPVEAMGMVDNQSLKEISKEVGDKLKRVVDNLDNVKGGENG